MYIEYQRTCHMSFQGVLSIDDIAIQSSSPESLSSTSHIVGQNTSGLSNSYELTLTLLSTSIGMVLENKHSLECMKALNEVCVW